MLGGAEKKSSTKYSAEEQMSEETQDNKEQPQQSQLDSNQTESQASQQELDQWKAKMAEMEAEVNKLRELQGQQEVGSRPENGVGTANSDSDPKFLSIEERQEIDSKSIYVGNVDFSATPGELAEHFKTCGTVNRVTILMDKVTGRPKGFAYVEFSDPSSVSESLVLNDSEFHGRNLKVVPKRTNMPSFMVRGRGRGRGGRGSFGPRGRGDRGGRGGRARGRARFVPY